MAKINVWITSKTIKELINEGYKVMNDDSLPTEKDARQFTTDMCDLLKDSVKKVVLKEIPPIGYDIYAKIKI